MYLANSVREKALGILLFLVSANAFAANADCPPLTGLQKVAGYVSGYLEWMNFIKLLGILAVAVGVCFIFWGVVELVIEMFFKYLLESALWIVSIGFIIGTNFVSADYAPWLLGIGSLILPLAMLFSAHMHKIKIDETKFSLTLSLLWGAVAMFYQSSFVGFFSVAAFLAFLGFSVVVLPLCYAFGFKDDASLWRGTVAGFFISAAYIATRAFHLDLGPAAVFESGALWLATFVCFLGLLITSSDIFWESQRSVANNYIGMNFFAVVTLLAFASAGALFGIREVTTLASVFMILYFAGKVLEIDVESAIGVGFKLVAVGAIIFAAWEFIRRNEAFFKPYLLM